MNFKMEISVIVPVYNDESRIKECLEAIVGQGPEGRYETIVVDDCSTDGTGRIVKDFTAVKLLENGENRGQSYCRNLGASRASGEYLFFVDSDAVIPKGAISAALSFIGNNPPPEIAGIQGTFALHDRFPNWSSALYNTLQHLLTVAPDPTYNVNTSCLLIRKETFYSLGSFNEKIWYMEDVEFGRRAAASGVLFQRNVIFFRHNKYISRGELFRQHFIGGVQLAYLNTISPPPREKSRQKYSNRYLAGRLRRSAILAIIFSAGFFHPLFWAAALLPVAADFRTLGPLRKTGRNIAFIAWGYLILHLIAVAVATGYLWARLFKKSLREPDRRAWLKSNYREERC